MVYYNKTHLRIRIAKTSYSLSAGSSDKTTILLPSSILATTDMYFQAMALTAGWQPLNVVIYCTAMSGSNAIQIRTASTLSSNVLLADIMFPRSLFAIS